MSNVSRPPSKTASTPQNLCLRCYGTNSHGYNLVMATLVDSVPDAIQQAKEQWKKISHRYERLNYKIFLGNVEISSGSMGVHFHHSHPVTHA